MLLFIRKYVFVLRKNATALLLQLLHAAYVFVYESLSECSLFFLGYLD